MDYFIDDDSQLNYAYRVESRSFERSIVNNTALMIAEDADGSSSQLFGKTINCMDIMIRKTGSPDVAYPVIFGVFGLNGETIHTFGTMNVTQVTTSSMFFKECDYFNPYTITINNWLGIKHEGSSAGNQIVVNLDSANPFGGTVVTHDEYNEATNTWSSFTANDMTMRLYFENIDSITVNSADFEFTELPKVMFALFGGVMILSGAIIAFREF